MDDEDIACEIPSDYWFKDAKTRCLLTCMVQQSNEEIATQCSSVTPGQCRENQHNYAMARVAKEHEVAREAHNRSVENDITH